jgi:hypothetical protein
VTLEDDLERALHAAAGHARDDERPVAAMPSEPRPGMRVYLAAFDRGGEELAYVALDGDGGVVSDRALVRDAVSVLALAERAEEVAGAAAADELRDAFRAAAAALGEAGDVAGRAAAERVVAAVDGVAAEAAGPRVATPGYLDRMAGRAAALAAAFEEFAVAEADLARRGDGPAAAAARHAAATMAGAGDPANFARAMTAAATAVEALVADVEASYRGALR